MGAQRGRRKNPTHDEDGYKPDFIEYPLKPLPIQIFKPEVYLSPIGDEPLGAFFRKGNEVHRCRPPRFLDRL